MLVFRVPDEWQVRVENEGKITGHCRLRSAERIQTR
jgi:hypothetical protein